MEQKAVKNPIWSGTHQLAITLYQIKFFNLVVLVDT